jgi:hypothetical protein
MRWYKKYYFKIKNTLKNNCYHTSKQNLTNELLKTERFPLVRQRSGWELIKLSQPTASFPLWEEDDYWFFDNWLKGSRLLHQTTHRKTVTFQFGKLFSLVIAGWAGCIWRFGTFLVWIQNAVIHQRKRGQSILETRTTVVWQKFPGKCDYSTGLTGFFKIRIIQIPWINPKWIILLLLLLCLTGMDHFSWFTQEAIFIMKTSPDKSHASDGTFCSREIACAI